MKSLGEIQNPESYKEVHSLLLTLSGGQCVHQVEKVNQDCALVKQSQVNCRDLSLVWSIDIIKKKKHSVQVLKVWDILLGTTKLPQLIKHIQKFYQDYSDETLNRCKEKHYNGYVFSIFFAFS